MKYLSDKNSFGRYSDSEDSFDVLDELVEEEIEKFFIENDKLKQYDVEIEREVDPFIGSIWDWVATQTSVEIIPRSEWGAKSSTCRTSLKLPVAYAFIHHTAGSAPTTQSAEEAKMRAIQRYHQNDRGFCDIGYNFVIMPSGRIYEGRGWDLVGAATKGYNSKSLSFCWAGNHETSRPTTASLDAGRALLNEAMNEGYLTLAFALRGHRDAASTACPGRYLYAGLTKLDPR
ncbi:MAG: peptidoglycan recognition protein [Candidatus Brocadiaceae bacterium]|nr:peptidoglycan recognition protein [Candidatus Brocadiaceae bacterium]